MSRFDQPTLVRYSSIATDAGEAPRPFRPRTMVYGGLLTTLAAAAVLLVLGRVPFEASVNRAPGSLYTVDADGWVRNTYLLKVTNKEAVESAVGYQINIDGLDDAVMIAPAGPVLVEPEQSVTIPMVIRIRERSDLQRTIPFQVSVRSESAELLLPTTFKTGSLVGGDD